MTTKLIAYDLSGPVANYADLIEDIKSLGTWWHHLDSLWLVNTDLSTKELRDRLKTHLDNNDELLVINVSNDPRAWTGFSDRGSEWLKNSFD
ncbi:SinR family protein [Frigoribacterium sp. CFBP 13707]|uniref:SinR family protein n=1 Tax=Frigoribacterium sp. CFBP 13707 TaxID=2775313 RepID=UPI0017860682|nr:SinR family protein [Frigoribacterium sp. CFBP 13707]MBD8729360.1 SinR family protein [Frigoribacterium sp. CFBP 13707]